MSVVLTVVKENLDQILQDSIERRNLLVLTHDSPQGWRMFNSRFVGGAPSSHVFQIETPVARAGRDAQLPRRGDTLGVTFRFGHKKCMFSTILESIEVDGDEGMAALRWPDRLQQLGRRAYERARPPKDVIIAVRFWRTDATRGEAAGGIRSSSREGSEDRAVCHGQLENLSAGGIRVRVADPNQIQVGDAYRCIFAPRPGKPSVILDAIVRHSEAAHQGRMSVGLQFVGMESAPQSRRTLDRLVRMVNEFQRARSYGRRGKNHKSRRTIDDRPHMAKRRAQ